MEKPITTMTLKKGILLLVSGIIAIAASFYFGEESEGYGFLVGFGYTASVGGVVGLLYFYVRNQKLKKQGVQ